MPAITPVLQHLSGVRATTIYSFASIPDVIEKCEHGIDGGGIGGQPSDN